MITFTDQISASRAGYLLIIDALRSEQAATNALAELRGCSVATVTLPNGIRQIWRHGSEVKRRRTRPSERKEAQICLVCHTTCAPDDLKCDECGYDITQKRPHKHKEQ